MHRGINIYDYISLTEFESRFVIDYGIKTFRVNPLTQVPSAAGTGVHMDNLPESAQLALLCTDKATYLTYLQNQCDNLIDPLLTKLTAGQRIIICLAQWPGHFQIYDGNPFHTLLMQPFGWKAKPAYASTTYPYAMNRAWSSTSVTVVSKANSPLQTYKDAISYLVGRYGGNPKVLGYDIAGEPQQPRESLLGGAIYYTTWRNLSIEIVKLIKQGLGTNPHNQITFVGARYANPTELFNMLITKKGGVDYYDYPYPKTANVTLKFHFYDPFEFTSQGIDWASGLTQRHMYDLRKIWPRPWRSKPWNEDHLRTAMDGAVQAAKAKALDGRAVSEGNKQNITLQPLWIGEFASVRWAPPTNTTPERPGWTPRQEDLTENSRLNWLKQVIKVCSRTNLQISWSYLDSISASLSQASPCTNTAPWSLIHVGGFTPQLHCLQCPGFQRKYGGGISMKNKNDCPSNTLLQHWIKCYYGSPDVASLSMNNEVVQYLKSQWALP